MPLAVSRPLLDMLGARWMAGARAAGVAWDGPAGTALRALAMALSRSHGLPGTAGRRCGRVGAAAWTSCPRARRRRRSRASPSMTARASPWRADPDGGFLSGGADGRLARVQAGRSDRHRSRGGPGIAAAPLAAGGRLARRRRGAVRSCRPGRIHAQISMGTDVSSIAVAPDGARVAIAHEAA